MRAYRLFSPDAAPYPSCRRRLFPRRSVEPDECRTYLDRKALLAARSILPLLAAFFDALVSLPVHALSLVAVSISPEAIISIRRDGLMSGGLRTS
jgi:hypothetical protein